MAECTRCGKAGVPLTQVLTEGDITLHLCSPCGILANVVRAGEVAS